MRIRKTLILVLAAAMCLSAAASDILDDAKRKPAGPSVTLLTTSPVAVKAGRAQNFELIFRVGRGYHINSNKPNSEFLIPTVLKISAPTDVAIGRLQYPAGQDFAFDFAPGEMINVYSGDFSITGVITTTRNVVPGKHRVRGSLTYQACDNRQCFPPKQLPVEFDVAVGRR